MKEKLLENWLDKTTERSFTIPFSYVLSAEGHKVVHITRHCGLELGKDVITITPDGIPCAFQIKTAKKGRISISQWREINSQLFDLVTLSLSHPSISSSAHHRSYFVTNGFLDEEVVRAIEDFNRSLEERNYPRLEIILKGEILEKIKNLQIDIWPDELKEIKQLLEILSESGKSNIPKDKITQLFERILFLEISERRDPSRAEIKRAISSCALLCSIATSEFSNENNFFAEIEAWTIFSSYVLACAMRYAVPKNIWKDEIEIGHKVIYNALNNLYEEIKERTHLVEGDALSDEPFFRGRINLLLSLMSLFLLWRKYKGEPESEIEEIIRKFCLENKDKMIFWGEAAIPQFLAFFWYYRKIDGSCDPDFLLRQLIKTITDLNKPRENGRQNTKFLASPYYSLEEIAPYHRGYADKPLNDFFLGQSYCLESLVHLFVRRNWKQNMKVLWPDITRIKFASFKPEHKWHYFLWRAKKGTNIIKSPKFTKNWGDLKRESNENRGSSIPNHIKQNPIFFLLFLIIYPHRTISSAIRWLDSEIMKL